MVPKRRTSQLFTQFIHELGKAATPSRRFSFSFELSLPRTMNQISLLRGFFFVEELIQRNFLCGTQLNSDYLQPTILHGFPHGCINCGSPGGLFLWSTLLHWFSSLNMTWLVCQAKLCFGSNSKFSRPPSPWL